MSAIRPNSGTPPTDGSDAPPRGGATPAVTVGASVRRPIVLVAGLSGVGKTSVVNSLFGVALPGGYDPSVAHVEHFHLDLEGSPLSVVFAPNPDEFEDRHDVFINMLRTSVKEVDSLWYVTRLDDTRVRSDEKRAIQLLSQTFQDEELGKGKVWQSAVIVFTFAGRVTQEMFPEALSKRTQLIRREIALHAGPDAAEQVMSVAVENTSDTTPDGKPWKSILISKVMPPLLRAVAVTHDNAPVTPHGTGQSDEHVKSDSLAQQLASPPDNIPRIRRYEEVGRKMAGKFGAGVGRVIGRVATWMFGS